MSVFNNKEEDYSTSSKEAETIIGNSVKVEGNFTGLEREEWLLGFFKPRSPWTRAVSAGGATAAGASTVRVDCSTRGQPVPRPPDAVLYGLSG